MPRFLNKLLLPSFLLLPASFARASDYHEIRWADLPHGGATVPAVHARPRVPARVLSAQGPQPAPLLPMGTARPLAAAPGPGPASPAPITTFPALGDDNTAIPPDTHGAAGPAHLMLTFNTQVRVQDKTGGNLSTVALGSFWSAVAPSGFTFDPRVYYDEDSARFVAVALNSPRSAASKILRGVSVSSDPTGSWYLRAFDADAGDTLWADYPAIGINSKWIAFSASMFTIAGDSFAGTKMWVFDKSSATAPGALSPVVFSTATFGSSVPSTQGALTYGSEPNLYFVDSQWTLGGNSYLRLSRLSGPTASPVWSLVPYTGGPQGAGFLQVPNSSFPLDASQPGTVANDCSVAANLSVCTGDARIINAVFRNGKLWTTHAGGLPVASPNRSIVYWYQIDPTVDPPLLVQSGSIDEPTGPKFYYYPSIAVDAFDNAALGFTGSSSSEFASAYYAARSSADAPGTMQSPTRYKSGVAKYQKTFSGTSNRWGDYSATVADPVDAGTFWTVQEYAEAPNGCAAGFDCWGTQWAKFSLTEPVTSSAAAFAASPLGVSSITWTWTAPAHASFFNVYYATSPAVRIASATTAAFTLTGLLANTTYAIVVKGANGVSEGPAATAPSTSTLAAPPTGASVTAHFSSATVTFTSCPAAPQSSSCSGYLLQASADAGFSGTVFSSASLSRAESRLQVSGLSQRTTYHLRLASLSATFGPNHSVLGPSVTGAAPVLFSSGATGSGSLSLLLTPAVPQLRSVRVTVPPGAFPSGTVVDADASGSGLPPPLSNQGAVTALGAGVGLSLTAGGLQPASAVTIAMEYDLASLPAGADPRRLHVFRFDAAAGQWTLLPSVVDAGARVVTASTDHFSFFAPFLVAPSAGLAAVNAFPVPWKPGSGDARFDALALSFSNLPADASVRLLTLSGELLWRGTASAGGTLSWTGEDARGRRAPSGTYLAVIEGAGAKAVRRVVLIR